MKLRYFGQAAMAGAVSLGIVLGIAACGQDNTIDYVYVTNNKNSPGQINIYLVDHLSGTLQQVKKSPVAAGSNPIDIAATANGKYLYVANHDDNTVVQYSVADDASLTQGKVTTTPGTNPTSLSIDSTGTYLFVTDAFQPQYSATNPGPGALVIYPISQTDGTLGAPLSYTSGGTTTNYFPTCNNPVAVTVLNNAPVQTNSSFQGAVYVVNDPGGQPPKIAVTTAATQYTPSGNCTANTGQLTAYTLAYTRSGSASATLGTVAPVTGSPFAAGTAPDAIKSDIQDRFVYVADLTLNQLIAYTISGAGFLTPINNGPFPTGNQPDAITIDLTNQYMYVANFRDNSISGYQISANGVPSGLSSGGAGTKQTQPVFVYVEPSSGRYLYASNLGDGTITGLHLNINTGALSAVQNSPFPANGQPTAMTAVTHGSHSSEILPIY